jgi:hypothetical protein
MVKIFDLVLLRRMQTLIDSFDVIHFGQMGFVFAYLVAE